MSIRVMTWVFDQELPPNGKFVLLAMADHAHDYGGGIYPSIDLLARKTGYGPRQVQRIISELLRVGVLKVEKESTLDRPMQYRINMMEPVSVCKSEFSPRSATPQLRREVIEAFHQQCYHCGRQGKPKLDPDGTPWEVDLVKSGRDGGTYTRDNVVLSCRYCNGKSRGRHYDVPAGGDVINSDRGRHMGQGGTSPVTSEPSLETSIEPSVELPEETTRKVIKELALQAQDTAIKAGVSITSKAAHLKACEERIAEAYSHRVQALSDANPEMPWTDLVILVGGNDPLDPTGERAKARKAEELAQREATLLAQHAEAEEADKQRLAEQEAFYASLAKKTPQELRRARRLVK